jgi:dihydrofolate reductase
MGKLIVTEIVTLVGVAQAPSGPDEDRDGFAHGGWQAPLLDQDSDGAMFEQARSMDALLLGRRTYEIFANYWPSAPEEISFTGLLNRVPKYVASRTLAGPLAWQRSTLVAGDLADDAGHRVRQRWEPPYNSHTATMAPIWARPSRCCATGCSPIRGGRRA